MSFLNKPATFFAGGLAFLAAMTCGAAVALPAVTDASRDASSPPASSEGSFPVNALGQTYGSDFDSRETPDLVLAIGDNGRKGYVRASELYGDPPESAEEAAQQMKAAGSVRVLTLYAEDGQTVLGTFTTSPVEGFSQAVK